MKASPRAVTVELTVPFHDVDALHLVWHGHYLKYLEIARMEFFRKKGLDVEDIRRLGYKLLITESHLKHVAPLSYNDRFRVTAWLTEIEARLEMEFEVFNLAAGRRAAMARSVMVVLTAEEGRLCIGTPEPLLERLR